MAKDIITSTALVSAFLNFLLADSHASYINPCTKFSSLIKSLLLCQDLSPQKFSLFISKIRCHYCEDLPIRFFICLFFLKKNSVIEHIPISIIHGTNGETLLQVVKHISGSHCLCSHIETLRIQEGLWKMWILKMLCECVFFCRYTWWYDAGCPWRPDVSDLLGVGVTGSCDSPDMVSGRTIYTFKH